MKRFLPDVNTLLALLDPMHVHHEAAHHWYPDPYSLARRSTGGEESRIAKTGRPASFTS